MPPVRKIVMPDAPPAGDGLRPKKVEPEKVNHQNPNESQAPAEGKAKPAPPTQEAPSKRVTVPADQFKSVPQLPVPQASYVLLVNGENSGPFVKARILSGVATGEFKDETLACLYEGTINWLPPTDLRYWKPLRMLLPEVIAVKREAVSPRQVTLAPKATTTHQGNATPPLQTSKEGVSHTNQSAGPSTKTDPPPLIAHQRDVPQCQPKPVEAKRNDPKKSQQSESTIKWTLGAFGIAFILVCWFFIVIPSLPEGSSDRTVADSHQKAKSEVTQSEPTEVSPSSLVAQSTPVTPPPIIQPPPPQTPQGATSERPFINSLGMKFVPVKSRQDETILFCTLPTRSAEYRVWKVTSGGKATDRAVTVSWNDATAFCGWLTSKDRDVGLISGKMRYRLPTDAEWSEAFKFRGQLGLSEMVGGVFQWCEDLVRKNHRVLRGGNRSNGDTHGDEPPSMRYGFRVVLERQTK
jgi:hypothetical protein